MEPFPTEAEYRELRARMRADGEWADGYAWAQDVRRPVLPDEMARELAFVICNSGMKNTVARRIYERVRAALYAGSSAGTVFGHKGKAAAIDAIWRDRDRLHAECLALDDAAIVEWCGRLPWIGKVTKYHAAKNLGADVAKPDRWLDRLAERAGESVEALCRRLALASGDRVATVDLVLWWGCAHGQIAIPDGGARPALADRAA